MHQLWLDAVLCGQCCARPALLIWTSGLRGLALGSQSITGSLLLHPRVQQASFQGLRTSCALRSMLALWLPTWLCPMPLTHSQTSCPWHLWAFGLWPGCLASLNMGFQALSSWVGQIRTSGCYFFSYMFALLTAPGFAIWTPTAVKDITILFLSCICLEAKGRSENKNIIVCFFWRQNRLTQVMWVLQTQCWLNSPALNLQWSLQPSKLSSSH